MIPVGASGGKAGMAGASQGVMFALDNEFGFGESIVIADMVDVEMGANQSADVVGLEAEILEMLEDAFFILRSGSCLRPLSVRGESGVDQDVPPTGGFDEIATAGHFKRLAPRE